MTESEWLTSIDAGEMIGFLRQRGLYKRLPGVWSSSASHPEINAAILRDVFGNPFRLVRLWPFVENTVDKATAYQFLSRDVLAWNDHTIPSLAQAIYDEAGEEKSCVICKGVGRRVKDNVKVVRAVIEYNDTTVCNECLGTGKLPGTNILNAARLAILADAVDEACAAVGVQAPEELVRHLQGWVQCSHCWDGGKLGRITKLHWPCECHGTGWLRSQTPHVQGCFAVELLRQSA